MRTFPKVMSEIQDDPAVSAMRRMFLFLFVITIIAWLLHPPAVSASLLNDLPQSFAVLGSSTVTSVGSTTIHGDLGLYPGTSVTGFPPGVVIGTMHVTDAVAEQMRTASFSAYNALAGRPVTVVLTGQDLGGLTLTPGVYKFDTSAQLTGILTLDFSSNPQGDFVFQIGSTLTTASSSVVNVTNGSPLSGVYWQVGSSATLGTDSSFVGNILANTSITLTTSSNILSGRAIALNGAVTMDTNTIYNDNSVADFGSYGYSGGNGGAVPEPSTILLLGVGVAGFMALRKSRNKVGTGAV